jgi:hypothetical protein
LLPCSAAADAAGGFTGVISSRAATGLERHLIYFASELMLEAVVHAG